MFRRLIKKAEKYKAYFWPKIQKTIDPTQPSEEDLTLLNLLFKEHERQTSNLTTASSSSSHASPSSSSLVEKFLSPNEFFRSPSPPLTSSPKLHKRKGRPSSPIVSEPAEGDAIDEEISIGFHPLSFNGKEYELTLTHSLIKFNDSNDYFIIEGLLGSGSAENRVKLLKKYYQKIDEQYYFSETPQESIVKIIHFSKHIPHMSRVPKRGVVLNDDDLWNQLKLSGKFEIFYVKESGDLHASIAIDEVRKKLYLKNSRVFGISLFQFMQKNRKLSLIERLKIISQVAEVILMLHQKNMVHLDIKLENIMINEETRKIGLIDFGTARSTDGKDTEARYRPSSTLALASRTIPKNFPNLTTGLELLDAYSSSGVFGLILSEWTETSNDWLQLPIFSKKNKTSLPYGVPYAFDQLKNVSYLQQSEKVLMTRIIIALSQLGHEDFKERLFLSAFKNRIDCLISALEQSAFNLESDIVVTPSDGSLIREKIEEIEDSKSETMEYTETVTPISIFNGTLSTANSTLKRNSPDTPFCENGPALKKINATKTD